MRLEELLVGEPKKIRREHWLPSGIYINTGDNTIHYEAGYTLPWAPYEVDLAAEDWYVIE